MEKESEGKVAKCKRMWKKEKVNWKTVLKKTFNRRGASGEDNGPEKRFLQLQGSNQSTNKILNGIEAHPGKQATSGKEMETKLSEI